MDQNTTLFSLMTHDHMKKLHKSETSQAAPCAWAIYSQHLVMVPCCFCTGQITQKRFVYYPFTFCHLKYNNN